MPHLTCAYVVTLDEPYRTRALVSITTLRLRDPDLHVTLIVPTRPDRDTRGAAGRLLELADEVRHVAPLHEVSGYFQDNRRYLGDLEAEQIVYLDADTFVFGSVGALAARFADADIAGRPSPWIWRRGYDGRLAPDILHP